MMNLTASWQRVRLTIGIAMAWMLSALSLLSWMRRLPTLAVLARRRLRRAVLGQNGRQTVSDPATLWYQNSALPGNRKDGFRYDYLLLLLIITPVYLWLELSFGVNLLDTMGGDSPTEKTDAMEHWGRLISGLAVALLFLKGWFAQCEKWNRPWSVRVVVSAVICLVSVALTWKIQDTVIDFYVRRAAAEISLSLASLIVVVGLCIFALRGWLNSSMTTRRRGLLVTLAGTLVLLALSVFLVTHLEPMLAALTRQLGWSATLVHDLGRERQQAATLTLARRGLQQKFYAVDDSPVTDEAIRSAEGKAALALFPIVGAGMDQARFAADRPALLRELMYRDWDEQSGDPSYAAYQNAEAELRQLHAGPYAEATRTYEAKLGSGGRKEADAFWEQRIRELMQGGAVSPRLGLEEFARQAASRKIIRLTMGCFDCEFAAGMERAALTRELFKWTQADKVRSMLDLIESPERFERGHDGETAARTYWVPIWALLFSMLGAFTHIFKIAFTATEYVQRRTLKRADAADSELGHALVRNGKLLLALALLILALFIYFTDNRVTGNESYIRLHQNMWADQPIVGAIATHWTINAQGLIYPFTKKIRPPWLHFENDPLDWLGLRPSEDNNE